MLKPGKAYEEIYHNFKWEIPEYYNMGIDICDKWANQRYRLALVYRDQEGKEQKYTFWELKNLSNQLANALKANGIEKGDRVGILLPQCPETLISHISIYKLGGIAIPLFILFGPQALEYRLGNSQAKGVVTDSANLPKILEIKDHLPNLEMIMVVDSKAEQNVLDFWGSIEKGSRYFTPISTKVEDPALIIYTSGTTGPPKGALHAHRVLLGHLPGVEFAHNLFPKEGDFFWTPADWAWIGGLMDVLFPSLHHGVPVLAYRARKFDPEEAFYLIAKYGIRNSFMPPTALNLMRQVDNPKRRYDYKMRSIGSGGETLGEGLLQWGREVMDLEINEFYGQTECNLVVGNCAEVMKPIPGSMGRAIPGHVVEIINESGEVVKPGEYGEIAIKLPDPVMFLGYWGNPEATKEKFIGDWLRTGDMGRKDENGYFWFVGREDDVIESGAYRIGPGELEDCLMKHEAVALAAVVGIPDKVRGEIVKAFIVAKEGVKVDKALEDSIKQHVKTKLEAYAYPREIEFVKELPMSTTGKIMRKELRRMDMEKKAKKRNWMA
jgi:acetyl-CoA synthetase